MSSSSAPKFFAVVGLLISLGVGVWIMLPKSKTSVRLEIQMTPTAEASLIPPRNEQVYEMATAPLPKLINPEEDQLLSSKMYETGEGRNKALLALVDSSLEKLLELANSDRDPSLVESAMVLGEIEQKYEADLQLREHVISFYQDCAKLHDLAPALRAVCFSKAVKLSLLSNGELWDPKEIPQNIKELASQL